MSGIFIALYQFFNRQKAIFWLICIGISALCVLAISRLEFEEDITKVMPVDEKIKSLNKALENVKFTDKIVINISLQDSASKANPDVLQATAEKLNSGLEKLKPDYISEITYKIEDDKVFEVFDLFYENLPLYLDEADYLHTDSIISPEKVNETMLNNYKTLLTPAGSFIKKTMLRDPLSMSPRALKKLKNLNSDDNFILNDGFVFTKDEKNLLMFILPTHPAKKSGENAKLVKKLDELIAEVETGTSVKVQYFGAPVVAAGNANQIKYDINITMTVVAICLFLFLLYFYRNFYYFFILIIPVVFGGMVALAVIYLLRQKISAVSVGVGAVLLGITIDYALHVFTHYRSVRDIKKLLSDLSESLIISCLTTVSAFFCLLFTDSEALQDLGLFAGISVFAACICSLVILPHFLKKENAEDAKKHKITFIDQLAKIPIHKNKIFTSIVVLFTLYCLVFYSAPVFESNMDNLNFMSQKLKDAESKLNSTSKVSLKSVFLIASGNTLNEALTVSEKATPIIDQLTKEGIIQKTGSVSGLILSEKLQAQKIDRWNQFWTPEKRKNLESYIEKSASKLKFKKGAFSEFYQLINRNFLPKSPEKFDKLISGFLKEFVNVNDSGATVISVLSVNEKDKPAVYKAFEDQTDLVIFDKKYLTEKLTVNIKNDFNLLLNLSFIIVFVILLVIYGRIELALIAYIPVILGWFWTMGFMHFAGMNFNIINIIISSFVFGLGVDYSVFITNGLLQDYKNGDQNLTSYKTSVYLSAITTIIGVGSLIFAVHPALRSVALLSASGIFSVLILSNTLIPLMFEWLITSKTKRGFQPLTLINIIATLAAYLMILIGFIVVTIDSTIIMSLFFIPKKYRKIIIHYMVWIWANIYLLILFQGRKKIINEYKEKFKNPAIIISNHQSFIDVPFFFALSPKIILTMNKRIYNNPIFGPISRFCDFLNVSDGIENMSEKIQDLVNKGYSIVVFPEGTRSPDYKIKRFHKGAFKLAEEMNVDIVPIVIHGTGDFLHKGEFWGRLNPMTVKIGQRVPAHSVEFGENYNERSKAFCKLMRSEYEILKTEYGASVYQLEKISYSYIYKSPVLEWYMKIKVRIENKYRVFHELLPKEGKIYDLGCGLGFMSYALALSAENREITGIDYDENKISTARNNYLKNEHIHFVCSDLTDFEPDSCKGIVISDVLHYLMPSQRKILLHKCLNSLLPGGVMLIKDGDAELKDKQKFTEFTERWSTKIFRFNKTKHNLHFITSHELSEIVKTAGFEMKIAENPKVTSNKLWLIYKPQK